MFDNLFKSKIDNVSKRSMTDDELAHLIGKIKHILVFLKAQKMLKK